MKISSLSHWFVVSSFAVALAACGGTEASEGSSGDSGDTSSGTSSTSSTSTDTGDTSTTGATDSTDGSFVPTDDTTTTGTTTSTTPGPNGSMCSSDAECESMICVDIAGFAGLCSECRTDQECIDAGTGLNCSIGAAGFFECGNGSAGQMCMSDAGCESPLVCAEVIDLGGLFNDSFCSECADDSGCMNGELCTPVFDLMAFTGERECAAAGSVAHSGLCDVGSSGQCTTGICEAVSVMGFIEVGICGDCDASNACATGTCTPGELDLLGGGGLSGSTCN
jgi:hypothetical protein